MRIKLLLFGSLAEAAGPEFPDFEVREGADVNDVLLTLAERAPALRGRLDVVAVAVGRIYAKRDRRVTPGDEVAVMPPVSGG